jgi:hypothetical protein
LASGNIAVNHLHVHLHRDAARSDAGRDGHRAGFSSGQFGGASEPSIPRILGYGRKLPMMIFMGRIEPPPPLVPQTNDEQLRLRLEAIAAEDRWVRNFIDRLAGVDPDTKH